MKTDPKKSAELGIVVIGRNEGARLERCLDSILECAPDCPLVYVDSGSSDGSVRAARSRGVLVCELDRRRPFSMARGRNRGFYFLINRFRSIRRVQFIDGDCVLDAGWLSKATDRLNSDEGIAIVCGRRQELFPHASIYNRLMDSEWNQPAGEVEACGGDFMARVNAFRAVGGFREELICGEEPDLCARLRAIGCRIHRISEPMTLHDAHMHHFREWWLRSVRGGWAFAQAAIQSGRNAPGYFRRAASAGLFGAAAPLLALALAWFAHPAFLAMFCVYPALMWRIYRLRLGLDGRRGAWRYAFFCVLAKTPQAWGQALYLYRTAVSHKVRLIEYKRAEASGI